MLEPIVICPLVYVLHLEDDCWYVGVTYNFNQRYAQHLSGAGAKWTRLHKPVSVEKIVWNGCEQEVTEEYITLYGRDKVRGGSHTRC
jgi:predicted GIY-YIG superfamily endonuclease